MTRRAWAVVAAVAAVAVALAAWWSRGRTGAATGGPGQGREPGRAGARSPALAAPAERLYAALDEEHVAVPSGVVVEAIETDRPWVCAGETIRLTARVGGEVVEGAAPRWVWLRDDGSAGLEPGATMLWIAPERAGPVELRFQVAKDVGPRRVGVLAEQTVAVDVRACAEAERQENEPLRVATVQRGHDRFEFVAAVAGERPPEFRWDFGDGKTETTGEPAVEHTYDLSTLGPRDTAEYVVAVEIDGPAGPLRATTVAFAGGRITYEPSPVDMEIGPWAFDEDARQWRTPLTLRPREEKITWFKLERILRRFDDTHEVVEMPWEQAVKAIEALENGGFAGYVIVLPEEVPPEIKQIVDQLHGLDPDGDEVVVSWTPFKRATAPASDPRGEDDKE